jgi:UDP-N-acetylglucosamine 2-epimerase
MRVLRVHAPGTDAALAAGVGRAVLDFNRALDIRLRFLAIGVEETVLEVRSAAEASEALAAALKEQAPDAVLLLGDGPAALAAATCTVRERAILVRVGAGRRGGPDADASRAVDRLAALHLVHAESDAAALAGEGSATPLVEVGAVDDAATGEKIVRALSRARRAASTGSSGGR